MIDPKFRGLLNVGGINEKGEKFVLAQEVNRIFRDKTLMRRIQMENLDERLSKLQKAEHFSDDIDKPHRLD